MRTINRSVTMMLCLAAMLFAWQSKAKAVTSAHMQKDTTRKGAKADKEDSDNSTDPNAVSTILISGDKNSIFNSHASFTYQVKNPTDADQDGTVSYQVFTEKDEPLNKVVLKVHIAKKSLGNYNFDIPEDKPGFYKVHFMVNVTDYDDTTRRAFGIKPETIRSQHAKPADFDQFWDNTKAQLAAVAPKFKIIPMPKLNTANRNVFLIEMQSLDNYTIRGWMTVPKTTKKNHKFPVLLGLPGYQVDLKPIVGIDNDMAIITLNVRGQGNSRGPIDTRRDEYLFYHVEDKNNYVMRGAIMDCVRCVDFICAQPNLRHDQIVASGGSMGGYLALALAGVDHRVALCSAQNPILCDIRNLQGEVKWPITDYERYAAIRPGLTRDKLFDNLDYFDGKNFATRISCSTMVGIGLLDPLAPPNNEYAAFNNIQSEKRILVSKDLGHEVSIQIQNLQGRWVRDSFALF